MSEIGEIELRAEVVDKTVKGFANRMYKFKPAVTVSPTTGWSNVFYQETNAVITSPTDNTVKGIPRGANFPQATPSWTKVSVDLEKYGIEDNIFWEDILTNNIDVQSRVLYRVAERVTKSVDDQIWAGLTENQAPTNIGSYLIGAGSAWNGANPAVIVSIMGAKQQMAEQNYDVSNTIAFISPKDYASAVVFYANRGANFQGLSAEAAGNGRVGQIAGTDIVVSNSVTANYAAVVIPKVCATWREAYPLTTQTIVDPMKSVKVRAAEIGVLQLTDPRAVVLISGTQV